MLERWDRSISAHPLRPRQLLRVRTVLGIEKRNHAEARKFPIWKIGQIRAKSRAVDCKDAKVKWLKAARRDDDRRCERPRPREFQIDISFTCGPVISRGSVISWTSAAVTPGASSINFSPSLVTSITQ